MVLLWLGGAHFHGGWCRTLFLCSLLLMFARNFVVLSCMWFLQGRRGGRAPIVGRSGRPQHTDPWSDHFSKNDLDPAIPFLDRISSGLGSAFTDIVSGMCSIRDRVGVI